MAPAPHPRTPSRKPRLNALRLAFGTLAALLVALSTQASVVVPGSTPGERVYSEDFTVPGAVDTGAGEGPGLDQTAIDGMSRLVQLSAAGSSFVTDFDNPLLYTFDPSRIQVTGSQAVLGDTLFPDLLTYWRMEEPSWTAGALGTVLDSSGNGRNGTAVFDATTTAAGQIGRAGTFDGSGDAVNFGQLTGLPLQPTDEYTLSAWFRTNSQGAILSKADDDFSQRQLYLFVINGRLWGAVGGNQNFGNTTNLDDGQWHHAALVNYDDSGVMRYRLYVDGVLDGIFDSGTATNAFAVLVGARRVTGNTGLGFFMEGEIDEVMLISRALEDSEVDGLYNAGSGRILQEFPADAPSIVKTAGDSSPGITDFTSFTETLGPGNQGSVEYQLSTDGVDWRYWNGLSWASATLNDRNDAATIDANISLFDASAGSLFVRTFLLSDGTQEVELDRLEVGVVRNFSGAFSLPYDVPGDYTFDPTKVRIENSLARLDADPDFFNEMLGYWRMEEASWTGNADEVLDRSGFAHHGTALGDANTIASGQIGRAGTFDGTGDAVHLGQPSTLDLLPTEEYTVSTWFRTTDGGAIFGEAVGSFSQRQSYVFTTGGQFWGAVGGNQNFGSATGLNDGQWHHGTLVNFDDGGTMRYRLYVDGVLDGEFLSGTATSNVDYLIGARRENGNTGLGFPMMGQVDEVTVFGRALDAGEVAQLYAAGAGLLPTYASDAPTVVRTVGDADSSLVAYETFIESPGVGHQGTLEYQLSDDGVLWQYWDGAGWTAVGGLTDRNDAAVVNAEIASFDPSAQQLFVRAFLVSDGSQAVELDAVTVRFETNQGAGSTEILGPVTAGFRFDSFTAVVEDEDADHAITFQFLEADAATLISDGVLPGNSTGFDSAAAALGVDLSGIGAGDLYVRVLFSNLAMDTSSAALDSFEVTYLDFDDRSDLSVTKSADVDPVVRGDELTYTLSVSNAGPSVGFDATLDDPLPPGTEFISLSQGSGWMCTTPAVGSGGTVTCTYDELPVGGPYLFTLVVRVPGAYAGPEPLVNTATVSAAVDPNPSDNSASASVAVGSAAPGSITVVKDAVPDAPTDFSFTGDFGPFTLDDANPDDSDAVPNSVTFSNLPTGDYSVTESLPVGWRRTGFSCTSNVLSLAFDTPYNDPLIYTFQTDEIEVTGGLARLREDPLIPFLLGYWRMEEAAWNGTPDEVLDESGLDHHGTAVGDATTFTPAQIGRGGTFDGSDAVIIGQPADLDLDPTTEFTISVWFRTTSDGALIAKAGDDFATRQFYLFVFNNRLWASIGGSQNFGGSIGASNGDWHHGAVVNRDDSGIMRYTIYFDGEQIGTFNSGTATNDLDVTFGARRDVDNSALDFFLNGDLDEAMMIDRALTATEILGLWANGSGRVVAELSSAEPPIVKTFGDMDTEILSWDGFDVTLGPGNVGTVDFQLSTDGINWQYFDGLAWTAAAITDRNDAATVAANIASYDRGPGRIFVRAFLVSDGTEPVEIDLIRIPYSGRGLGDTSIADETATFGLKPGQDMVCTFVNEIEPERLSSLVVRKEATPQDGTDFPFTSNLLTPFSLDDANPDDLDGISQSQRFDDLVSADYEVTEQMVPGFELTGFNCDPGPTTGTFELTFRFSSDYTFPASEIEVEDGVARLLEEPLREGLLGYYRMEEASWNGTTDEVLDSSGNGFDGTAENGGTTTGAGLIGRAGTFAGGSDGVNLGQPSALDFNPAVAEFTLAAWFKTPIQGGILSKADADFDFRQFYLFVAENRLFGNVGGNQNGGIATGALDDEWHHGALVNYNDGGTMRYRLYFDGVFDGEFLSGNATNDSDIFIGTRRSVGNTGTAFSLNGEIDEAVILGRALSDAEIADLYNAGAGRVLRQYPTDGPAIFDTSGNGGAGLLGLTGFTETLGPGNQGQVRYQLSDDGITWQYWNGVVWAVASDTDRNTAAVIDANIAAFDVSADQLHVRSFLESDGSQTVELDNISVAFERLSDVPDFTIVDETVTIQLDPGEDVICTFINGVTATNATVTLELLADPALGTDFDFSGDLGAFTLDFALPDDVDGVTTSQTFNNVVPGSYDVTQAVPAGWTFGGLDCTSDDPMDTSSVTGSTATLDVDAGETLTCTFENLRLLTQITDTAGDFGANLRVATSAGGDVISFLTTRDLTGTNGDLSNEIVARTVFGFEASTTVMAPTDHAGTSDISRDGRYIVFESTADLLGTNVDGNQEIYRLDRQGPTTVQITDTTGGCTNSNPVVSGLGNRIAFTSDCTDLIVAYNADANRELVVWESGALTAVETTGCSSLEPTLSRELGDLVAFHSDCDAPYTANNADGNTEIFLWDWSMAPTAFTQVTDSSDASTHFNETVTTDATGSYLIFASNADYAGTNADASAEIFRYDVLGDTFEQLTDGASPLVVHSNAAVGDMGQHIGHESIDFAMSLISDVYHIDANTLTSTLVGQDATFDSEFPALARTRNGAAIVFFQSAADFLGTNGDGNVEIWRVVVPLP